MKACLAADPAFTSLRVGIIMILPVKMRGIMDRVMTVSKSDTMHACIQTVVDLWSRLFEKYIHLGK